jgi:hypothetical protein
MLDEISNLQWKANQWFLMADSFEQIKLFDAQIYCMQEGNKLLNEAVALLKSMVHDGTK